ncbi:MAG TPA: DUF6151 family protein [Polyangiaceae bacterium]|jgi:hypothetical protein|nr:DUF6151 family protein [Polyangiaceae bacterium]
MGTDIPVRCACGALQGSALALAPNAGARIICYCDDCQAFARFLGRPGITNERGGTDIFQMAPARVRLTSLDALACVRLSEKGMHRWYCRECKGPVGNTLGPKVPFVGVIHTFFDIPAGAERDRLLGPPLAHMLTRFATGGPLPEDTPRGTLRVMTRAARLLATWWLTGAGSPSPFFDGEPRGPRVPPRILSADERLSLRPAPAGA